MQIFATKRAAILGRSTARKIFSIVADELALVEAEFERQMRSNIQVINYLGDYVRESGGKRVRPALLVLSNYAADGKAADEPIIRLATVMEMLHTATLVHDDIIDNADIRRNRASVNARFGNQTAVLMGDWLYMSAFETSLRERSLAILDILTRLTRKMTEGELIQLTTIGDVSISEEAYYDILRRKTAYLFSACCEIGSISGTANAEYREALRDYGMNLGIAFQLADDLLDLTAEMNDLGKASGVDLTEGKMTLPLILLLKEQPELKPVLEEVMRTGTYEAISRNGLLRKMSDIGMIDRIRSIALGFAAAARKNLDVLPETEYRVALEAIPDYVIERGN